MTQTRSLGGSIGLAICVIVFNKKIRASQALVNELDPEQMSALLKSPLVISSFRLEQQALVARVYAKAFTQEMQVATYIAGACFVVSLFTWQRRSHRPVCVAPDTAPAEEVEGKGESETKPSAR